MAIRNTKERWGAVQQLLHWLVAPLVLLQLYLGVRMGGLPNELIGTSGYFSLHAGIGIAILLLMLLRLAWRMLNPSPRPPQTIDRPGLRTARLTHYGWYALLILLPVTGYLMAVARGYEVAVYGVSVPAVIGPTPALLPALFYAHLILAALAVGTLALHVGAALRHEFALKDNTLRRMTPLPARDERYASSAGDD